MTIDIYRFRLTQTEVPKVDNNSDGTTARRKKMGSLSITNPMDVLRQRFLLELQRRRQMQQQEQAKANREILNDIGKRSARRLAMIYPRIQTRNNQVYQPAGPSSVHVASDNPLWSRLERFDWYNIGNSGEHLNDAEQSHKVN
uniref:Corticotropin-releasing factor domain-containing protein n=1 Tax=Bracon brevicornis TaxID=1563983 RepID=A0A6V7LHJ2_9HYME